MTLFSFPEDARWNETADAVEFEVRVGEYSGVVRVRRQVFRHLLQHSMTPQGCIEAFHLYRSAFERAAEIKVRARSLTEDGNIELTLRDLRSFGGRS